MLKLFVAATLRDFGGVLRKKYFVWYHILLYLCTPLLKKASVL